MSKRAPGLERRKNDAYDTPPEPVVPLLSHLRPGTKFIEPCAGTGDLIRHLQAHGHQCVWAGDLEPREPEQWPVPANVCDATTDHWDVAAACFITNPPWDRPLLHPLIINLASQLPTWLLFDADWAFTGQAAPFIEHCDRMVVVGRVKWIPDSKDVGKDNAAWYRFDASHRGGPRLFPRLTADTDSD